MIYNTLIIPKIKIQKKLMYKQKTKLSSKNFRFKYIRKNTNFYSDLNEIFFRIKNFTI